MHRSIATLVLAALAHPTFAGQVTIRHLDPLLGEFPEASVLSADGTVLYASHFAGGKISAYDAETLEERFSFSIGAATGMSIDQNGDLLVATAPWFLGVFSGSVDPSTAPDQGVWRINSSGQATRVATLPFENNLPNGIAGGSNGATYVSNLLGDQIYRVNAFDQSEIWLQDSRLFGDPSTDPTSPSAGFPLGGNGLQVIGSSLFVSNTDAGQVLEVAINADGSAGEISVFAEHDRLVGIDGFQIDSLGNLYAANLLTDEILMLSATGDLSTLADYDDGLRAPAGLSLDSLTDPTRLYFNNFSAPFPFLDAGSVGAPGVGYLTVPTPGALTILAGGSCLMARRRR